MSRLTLVSAAGERAVAMPPRYAARRMQRSDAAAVGRLYFDAFDPGEACHAVGLAIADSESPFAGE